MITTIAIISLVLGLTSAILALITFDRQMKFKEKHKKLIDQLNDDYHNQEEMNENFIELFELQDKVNYGLKSLYEITDKRLDKHIIETDVDIDELYSQLDDVNDDLCEMECSIDLLDDMMFDFINEPDNLTNPAKENKKTNKKK